MKAVFKISNKLLKSIYNDLQRPHKFAHERVGFISAGLSAIDNDVSILAREYRPVADDDYLPDYSVGAMMGPEAIRKALQWSLNDNAIFHIHTHGGIGFPGFSAVDLNENMKFIPDFFKVCPKCVHGAIVLSNNFAFGHVWLSRTHRPQIINEFTVAGIPTRRWRFA